MLRFIWAQLRGRPRRTLAMLAGMLVATTGFTVLSAAAATSQLRVTGTVEANSRSAYDILVRPKGSRTELEDGRGLVRPNYLSGLFGGITMAQLDQVRAVQHVQLAAPIAMLGYVKIELEQTIDLTDQVDRNADKQLFRLTPSWIADRGLTVLDDAPQYVYLTRNPLVAEGPYDGEYQGRQRNKTLTECYTALEQEPDGRTKEVCVNGRIIYEDATTELGRTRLTAMTMAPDGRFVLPPQAQQPAQRSDRLEVTVTWPVLVLLAAIDPAAEAGLVDLDEAVVSGRYLTPGDRAVPKQDPNQEGIPVNLSYRGVPVIVADTPYVDEQVTVTVDRIGAEQAASVPGTSWEDLVPRLAAVAGTPAGPPVRSSGSPRLGVDEESAIVSLLFRPGPTHYRTDPAGALHPEIVPFSPDSWTVTGQGTRWMTRPPLLAMDTGFRPVTLVGGTTMGRPPHIDRVGVFDPDRLRGFSPLSRVPLETYETPEAAGADAESRRLLGDQPLRPNSNPAGYLATPPLVLTNLASLADFPFVVASRPDPLSAIRVRVAGVTGIDPHSRELVRTVAEEIATRTGLDVDVTLGSSPAPQTVVLPAGTGGRPELALSEGWSRKGVAVTLVQAADRKSLLLFGLILLVCTLFLANAVTAAVRDRRRELAVLVCLGWPGRRIAGVVLAEVILVGLVAGALAAALALSGITGIRVPLGHALLGLPVGLGVALIAAAVPTLLAARARPAAAVHPAVLGVRRGRRTRTLVGLAVTNLWRVPGRTALGVLALAVGIGALTILVAIAVAFHNVAVGSLLGDAVSVRVRGVDVLAAVTAVVLGVLIVADVLYINVRERAAELAALWACGWPDRSLLRLVAYEGLGIGLLGGLLGAGAGLLGVFAFTGQLPLGTVWLALGTVAGALVVAGLAAVLPALTVRRLPLSTVLAEE